MEMDCPKCGEPDQEGDFLGDHGVPEYYCDVCGYYWTDDDYLADLIDRERDQRKYER